MVLFSFEQKKKELELRYTENSTFMCSVCIQWFFVFVSHAYRHFPDISRNASSCGSLLPANEISQDWWEGLSPVIFFQALFCSLVFNQFIHGLKGSQKFSQEPLFLCRHSFCFLLLWCPCTDFTLGWVSLGFFGDILIFSMKLKTGWNFFERNEWEAPLS